MQIPWANFWSGDVTIAIDRPQLCIAPGCPQAPQPLDQSVGNLTESISSVAEGLLQEDEEGRQLEESLAESIQVEDAQRLPGQDSPSGASAPEAGSLVASIVESLLGRLKIQIQDVQVRLDQTPSRLEGGHSVGLELTVDQIKLRTETTLEAGSEGSFRKKVRTIEVAGLTTWVLGQSKPAMTRSRRSSDSASSTSSQESDNLMKMSQAVEDLASSFASTVSRYTDAESGQGSMYDSQAGGQYRGASSTVDSSIRTKILCFGTQPIVAQLTVYKHVPDAETATRAHSGSATEGPSKNTPTVLHVPSNTFEVSIGTGAILLRPADVCHLWTIVTAIEQYSSADSGTPATASKVDDSAISLKISHLVALCVYQEPTSTAEARLDESVAQFWNRPLRSQPAINHLRLQGEALVFERKMQSQEQLVEASIKSLSLLEHVCSSPDIDGPVTLPILVFDEALRDGHSLDRSRHSLTLHDWLSPSTSSPVNPYQRTTLGDQACKLKRTVSKSAASPSRSARGQEVEEPSPVVVFSSSSSTGQTIKFAPIHLFADLSIAERLIPFVRLLSEVNHASLQSSSASDMGGDSLASSVETVNAAAPPTARRQSTPAPAPPATVECAFVRLEVRVSSAARALRSGLLALDLSSLSYASGMKPEKTANTRVSYADRSSEPSSARSDITEASVTSIRAYYQPSGATRADVLCVVGQLETSSEEHEQALRPSVEITYRVSSDGSKQTLISCKLPLLAIDLSKTSFDGLQLLGDDLAKWSATLASPSSIDDKEGLRVLGSRFFGSRAGLSALSSNSSGSATTDQLLQTPGGSTKVAVQLTELSANIRVPQQQQQRLSLPDRSLIVTGRELRLELQTDTARHANKIEASLQSFAVEEITSSGDRLSFLSPTLRPSLSRGVAHMLSLNMLLFADPETHYRESRIEPLLRDCTVTLMEDFSLFKDLGTFLQAPAGVFENVEPNELTKLNVQLKGISVHLAPTQSTERGVLLLGDVKIQSRLVGDAPKSQYEVALTESYILLAEEAQAIPEDRRHRVKAALDLWLFQQYAKLVEFEEVRGIISTSKFTLPDLDVKVSKLKIQLSACADTLSVTDRLVEALSTRPPPETDLEYAKEEMDDWAGSSSSGSNILSSLDEEAFKRDPVRSFSVPDLLEDDIPSRPEFFGRLSDAPAADAYEDMPLTEEDFFGQESVASIIQPKTKASRARESPSGNVVLQNEVVTIRLLDQKNGLRPTPSHFSRADLSPQPRSITGAFASSFRLRIEDCDVTLKLHAGYDWLRTRSEIEAEIKRVRRRLQKIKQLLDQGQKPDDSVEDATDDLAQSIHISFDPDVDAAGALHALDEELGNQSETASSASTWQPLPHSQRHHSSSSVPISASASRKRSKLERSHSSMIDLDIEGLSLEYDSLVPEAPLASHLGVEIRSVQILDQIKTSTWQTFLTAMVDKTTPRVAGGSNRPELDTSGASSKMVRLQLLNLRPTEQSTPNREELRVRAKITPLRLHVDQDALDFFKKFFAFKRPSDVAKEASSTATPPAATGPFIQYAEVHAIKLKLDYKPKRVDYGLLRQGKTIEMMNFFHFDGAEMTLRHITLRGITGWARLFDTLNDLWTPDVKANQLSDVLSGIAPVRSLVNVGAGVADLILLPIEQFQKDGNLGKGLKKGAGRFAKATALEALRLGARLATGTQGMLERAEHVLGDGRASSTSTTARPTTTPSTRSSNTGSDDDETSNLPLISPEEHRRLISRYADQPSSLSDALNQAYRSLTTGVQSAAQTILAVPMDIYEASLPPGFETGSASSSSTAPGSSPTSSSSSSGGGSGSRKVMRAVPIAVMQGARGASEALSKTLMGLQGVLDEGGQREEDREEEKYKQRIARGSQQLQRGGGQPKR